MAQAPIELDVTLTAQLPAQAATQATQLAARQTLGSLLPTTTPSRQPPQRSKICNRCRKRLWDQRLDFAVKIFGILAFLLSCAALCPSICGQEDAHKATQLAEWSALKDFMTYCESVSLSLVPALESNYKGSSQGKYSLTPLWNNSMVGKAVVAIMLGT